MNRNLLMSMLLLLGLTAGTAEAQTPVIVGNPVTIKGPLKIVDGYAFLKVETSPNLSTINLIGTGGTAGYGRNPRISLWDGNASISSNLFYKLGVGWVRDHPATGSSRIVVGGDWIGFDIWPATGAALKNALVVVSNGNVGIGTINPQSKLAVDGTITTREVVVTNTGWADYVFRPGYRLPPLSEVNAYIQAHHHLPDIPSEAEVKKRGVSVGDMQAKLLAKVEELTLYMIGLEERNIRLQERYEKLMLEFEAGREPGK